MLGTMASPLPLLVLLLPQSLLLVSLVGGAECIGGYGGKSLVVKVDIWGLRLY